MKKVLEHIITELLDTKEVKIDEKEDNGHVEFTIHAPKDNIGLIIGKGGRTINSIKNILRILAIKQEKRVSIEIAEEE